MLDFASVMELRLRRQRGLGIGQRLTTEKLVENLIPSRPIHVENFVPLAAERLAAGIRRQHALQHAMEVKVRIDAEGEAVLDGVDVPDVHRVIDRLDPLAQGVPRFAVMAARAKAVRLQFAEADAHLLKMRLAIEAALVADGIDLGHDVAQFRMFLQQLDDLPDLIVETGPLRRIARGVVEARLFAKTRREDEAKRRDFLLKRAKTFVETEHHILGGQLADAGNLLRRISR